jgi:DNA helicase-2/ATP-dependent DNA helicase PcrA
MKYTYEQEKAINTIDSNLQIIACAGSGKTHVVSSRIINILRQKKNDEINPGNIVAFTFTEKAATELRYRITRLYEEEFGQENAKAYTER